VRGLHGDSANPIEARLEADILGVARWSWWPAHLGKLKRVPRCLRTD
jgi:hypothetical protein